MTNYGAATNNSSLFPRFTLGKRFTLRAIRIQGDVLVFFLFLQNLRLTTIFLQLLKATLLEFFTPSEFRDGLVCILKPLLAALAIAIRNLLAEILAPLDRHRFHVLLDPHRLKAVIPSGIKIRCANSQAIAFNPRAHRQWIPAWPKGRIHIETIKRQGLANTSTHLVIARSPANDLPILDVDICNVSGLSEESNILVSWKAMPIDRAAEITNAHERK